MAVPGFCSWAIRTCSRRLYLFLNFFWQCSHWRGDCSVCWVRICLHKLTDVITSLQNWHWDHLLGWPSFIQICNNFYFVLMDCRDWWVQVGIYKSALQALSMRCMCVFMCDDIAKQKPETKQNTNINQFQMKMEHKNKTLNKKPNKKWQTFLVWIEQFVICIPDVGPCPDRLASGVGVPPDENKRPDHLKKEKNKQLINRH